MVGHGLLLPSRCERSTGGAAALNSRGRNLDCLERENGTVCHTYTVMAPDPFVAPYYGFLLERTPKAQSPEPRTWRKDEYPS
jgi:hypothetical protein